MAWRPMAIYLNVTDVNELVSILFSPNSDAHSQYIGVEMGFFSATPTTKRYQCDNGISYLAG